MSIKIKEWCLAIASLGSIGHLPFGAPIAALLSFPLLIFLGWIALLNTTFFYVMTIALISIMVLSVHISLKMETDKHPGIIVINNMLGMLIAFMGVPVSLKFAIIGFMLFYAAKFAAPSLIRKFAGHSLEQWPFALLFLGFDITAGLLVNVFLRFVWWMAN